MNGAPGAIASYAYTLDAAGHRLGVTELSGRAVSYGYDSIYRLTSETIASDPNNVNGTASYVYDPVGNRTQKTSTIPGYPGGLTNYNANDQLTTDTYDNDGNTTASNGVGYVYDFENHVIQAGAGITIVYDGDGNRASKTVAGVTTNYLVDPFSPTGYAQVVYETFSGSTAGNREQTHTFSYGLELVNEARSNLVNYQSANSMIYFDYDGHGSVRALTDPNGNVTDTYDYDAFGNLLHSTGTTPNNYLFAGEQFDPDLGLYYNRARYLNTSTGRFWSMDTFEGGLDTPLSLHRYLYVLNDPVNLFDPSGGTALPDFIAKLAARGVQISAQVYGTLAHILIENSIAQKFFPNVFTEFPVPGGRIDVVILSGGQAHLYEIKPLGGTVPPDRQIQRYLASGAGLFRVPLVAGTLNFEDTIRGPLVFDKITYETAGPGVVVYQPALDPPSSPLPVPVPIATILTVALLAVVLVATLIGSRGPASAFI